MPRQKLPTPDYRHVCDNPVKAINNYSGKWRIVQKCETCELVEGQEQCYREYYQLTPEVWEISLIAFMLAVAFASFGLRFFGKIESHGWVFLIGLGIFVFAVSQIFWWWR